MSPLFPLASKPKRPLPNWLADRLVGGDGVEPFGLRLALVSQEVNQTQCLTLRSQRGMAALGRLVFFFVAMQRHEPHGRPRAAILRLPFAGELQGALADGGAVNLVGGDDVPSSYEFSTFTWQAYDH